MKKEELYELKDTEIYDTYYADQYEPERNFLLAMANKLGGKALDIACGTGIVSHWLAKKGVDVTGIDLSENMLATAKEKKGSHLCKYHLMDMRSFSLDETFPLAYLTGNAFMFLLSTMDQEKFLQCVHKHLDKNGMLVFDTRPAKSSLQVRKQEDFHLENEAPLNKHIQMKVYYKTQYDFMSQIIKYDIRQDYYVNGQFDKSEFGDVSLKLTFPIEFELLMKSSGFVIEDIFSSFDKDP